jgi:hypothetical protein
MTRARYHCKRYLLPLPKSIGDTLDTSVDYDLRLNDQLIVITPKKLGSFTATVKRLENEWQKAKRESDELETSDSENDTES